MAEYQDSQCYVGLKESDLYILTEFFKVLGNPTRIRILLLLMEQDANVSDLAERLDVLYTLAYYHDQVLTTRQIYK